jgi:hopanoid biosynthesis associated radical SAM protein HpnH
MLEPLFRCNLACGGCGKIQHPTEVLRSHLTPEQCFAAVDECGAPIVSIPGGEPLLHPQIEQIVEGLVARKKYLYLCTNALKLEEMLPRFKPSPYLAFSVHLDGLKEHHDKAVCQDGVFDRAVRAIAAAQAKGFQVNVNCTVFEGHPPEALADFLDYAASLKVGVSISPGFAYERAPDREQQMRARDPRAIGRDLIGEGFHPVVRHRDGRRAERVRLDEIGAGFEIRLVNGRDDIRPRQVQKVIVPAQRRGPVGKPRPTEVFFRQAVGLDHRAHRAIEDQDAPGRLGFESGHP